MKTISLAALSLLLLASSQLDRTEAVSLRQAEETVELPEDFDCKLCSKCGQSCTLQCNLCSGCDLLKAFDVSQIATGLQAFGVELSECDTFCSGGVEGCREVCEQGQKDCDYCKYC